ncbi:MAG: hypothetical protein D3903_11375 [Candidatus Electrothrix sp. GM3_4]|nr:hypothetical protein [Candidatus Electrothrix sp. GM3_4]
MLKHRAIIGQPLRDDVHFSEAARSPACDMDAAGGRILLILPNHFDAGILRNDLICGNDRHPVFQCSSNDNPVTGMLMFAEQSELIISIEISSVTIGHQVVDFYRNAVYTY